MKFSQHYSEEEVGINLTPLIDVVFLLLIFFMVSTTFDTTSQLKIKLPQASQQKLEYADDRLEIIIDAKGRFFLNSREISGSKSDALMVAIQRAITDQDQPVIIQSDAASPVQSLVTAMDVVGRLGLSRVSIATTRPVE